jgi:hypothetical protein
MNRCDNPIFVLFMMVIIASYSILLCLCWLIGRIFIDPVVSLWRKIKK